MSRTIIKRWCRIAACIAALLPLALPIHAANEEADSVISVGYTTTNNAVSGSVEHVGQDQMNRKRSSNALDAINGRVAGMTVQRPSNGLAAMNAVRVRGTTSLTGGNDPLIIVDGVFGDLTTLSAIYPADIESFTVLKDASETAQYGSRGASGVIEVTTKRGTVATAGMSYNGTFGVSRVAKNLNMLDADAYRQLLTQQSLMLVDHGHNTNWQHEIQQTGFQQDHHIAFTGGKANAGYRVALGYMNHRGVILHESMNNFTSNMSMHQTMFNDRVKVEVGMFGNVQHNTTSIYDVQKTFYSAASWNPTFSTERNAAGGWDGFTYANQINHPMALMDSRTRNKTTHLSTHGKISAQITTDWSLSGFLAFSHNEVEASQFLPTSIWAHGQVYKGSNKTESLVGNIMLAWDKSMASHHVNIMALAEAQRDDLTGFGVTTTNLSTDALGIDVLQAGALTVWDGTKSFHKTPTMAAFMSRGSWEWNDRYSLTITARIDGSSKFGKNHKWGFFPSASAAWTVSNENFMRDIQWLETMKLRVGVGMAGNQGGIDSYMSLNALQPMGIVPVGQGAAVSLGLPLNINPDLKWEVKRTFNTGIDIVVLNSRLFGSIDFYTSKTTDMLYLYNVPVPPFHYNKLLANIGSMSNNGLEISMGATLVNTRDIDLNINANVAWQRNKLLSLSGEYGDYYLEAPSIVDIGNLNGAGFHGGNNHIVYQIVGQPLGVFYLPHCTGLVDDGNGGYVYGIADLDNDGNIYLANGADRQVCGQAVPKVLVGSNFSLRYRNCDLAIQINGAFGHKIYNGTALTYMNMNSLPGYNVMADAPAMAIKDQIATDYWLEPGDYVNIDYITFGWNVPLKKSAIERLRLSLTLENLATITSYSGLTPMINSTNVSSTLGIDDKNTYPVTRDVTLGVSVYF